MVRSVRSNAGRHSVRIGYSVELAAVKPISSKVERSAVPVVAGSAARFRSVR